MTFFLRQRSHAADLYLWALSSAYRDGLYVIDPSAALFEDPEIYDKAMADPVFAQAVEQRAARVASKNWMIEPASDDEVDVRAAQVIEQIIRLTPNFTEARERLALADVWGSKYAQITGSKQIIRTIDRKPREAWVPGRLIDMDRRRWRAIVKRDGDRITLEWHAWHVALAKFVPLKNPHWYVKHVVNASENTLGHGHGVIESLHTTLYAKGVAMQDGLRGLHRWAQGVVVAKVDGLRDASTGMPNATLLQRWIDLFKKMQSEDGIAHDAADEVQVLPGPGQGHQIVKDFIDYCDNVIRVRLLGANLPSQADGGSFALGKVQQDSTEAIVQGSQEKLDDTLTNDYVRLVWTANLELLAELGLAEAQMGRFKTKREIVKNHEERARVIETVLRSGMPVKADEAYSEVGLTMPSDTDRVIRPGAGASPGQPVADPLADPTTRGEIPAPTPGSSPATSGAQTQGDALPPAAPAATQQAQAGGELEDEGYNGAQIAQIVDIGLKVKAGLLEPEQAKNILLAAFPKMHPDQVAGIVSAQIAPPAHPDEVKDAAAPGSGSGALAASKTFPVGPDGDARRLKAGTWDESKHERGDDENAGHFAPKGQGHKKVKEKITKTEGGEGPGIDYYTKHYEDHYKEHLAGYKHGNVESYPDEDKNAMKEGYKQAESPVSLYTEEDNGKFYTPEDVKKLSDSELKALHENVEGQVHDLIGSYAYNKASMLAAWHTAHVEPELKKRENAKKEATKNADHFVDGPGLGKMEIAAGKASKTPEAFINSFKQKFDYNRDQFTDLENKQAPMTFKGEFIDPDDVWKMKDHQLAELHDTFDLAARQYFDLALSSNKPDGVDMGIAASLAAWHSRVIGPEMDARAQEWKKGKGKKIGKKHAAQEAAKAASPGQDADALPEAEGEKQKGAKYGSMDDALGKSKPKQEKTPLPTSLDGLTAKEGTQAGSNPGGIHHAQDGTAYYVKTPQTDDHAHNEAIAAGLYDSMGVSVPQVGTIKGKDGKHAVISKMVDGAKRVGDAATAKKAKGAHEGFAADAWLANWDVVGAGHDNLHVDKDGNALRVDTGGALLFRAQGKPKGHAFGSQVTELDSLRKGSNPQASGVFGSMSDKDVVNSFMGTVAKMSDQAIEHVVHAHEGMGVGTRDNLVKTLKERRDYMADWAKKKGAKIEQQGDGSWAVSGEELFKTNKGQKNAFKSKFGQKGVDDQGNPRLSTLVHPKHMKAVLEGKVKPTSFKIGEVPVTVGADHPWATITQQFSDKSAYPNKMSEAIDKALSGKKIDGGHYNDAWSLVKAYTGSEYSSMNDALRGNSESESSKKAGLAMDALIAKHGKLPHPVMLLRGIKMHAQPHSDKSNEGHQNVNYYMRIFERAIRNGGSIQLKGMQSATRSVSTARSFSDDHGFLFKITAREGLPVRHISSHKSEDEIVLGHNRRYRVKAIHVSAKIGSGNDRRHIIELEQT